MSVQTCVTGSACQAFIVLKWNMSPSFWVFVAFGKTKINNIDYVLIFASSDKEIIWFNVSM